MMERPAVLLLSGGMDSAILLWWLTRGRPRGRGIVHALSVDYGQRHRVELEAAVRLARQAGAASHCIVEVDLTAIGGSVLTDAGRSVPAAAEGRQASTVVPFRNMLFVTLAAARAETLGLEDVFIAAVRDDQQTYRDCRRPFYDSLEHALLLGAGTEHPVRVHTPFTGRWKSQLVALGHRLGVPFDETHTCYAGQRPACGRCDACAERIAAFRAAGLRDPLPYAIPVDWTFPADRDASAGAASGDPDAP